MVGFAQRISFIIFCSFSSPNKLQLSRVFKDFTRKSRKIFSDLFILPFQARRENFEDAFSFSSSLRNFPPFF